MPNPVTPPLTTRESLAEVLDAHKPLGWVDAGWACECGHVSPLPPEHASHVADAVLAAGILADATKLAEDIEARRRELVRVSVSPSRQTPWERATSDALIEARDMIAAALSPAQSERAEVES